MNPLSAKEQAQELSAALKATRENWDYLVELYEVAARQRKLQFDEYIKAGFTEAQAVEFIKAEITR